MIKPRALRSGDRLAIVAPSSAFKREEFDAGVGELRRIGFEPVFDEAVFARDRYFAGTASQRAAAVRRAFADSSIAGIVCVRGGYGSTQVLPLLDGAELVHAEKPFVGYSDVTSILTFLTLHAGLVAFHGPMLSGRFARGTDGYDRASFEGALCRPEALGELAPPGLEIVRRGVARGPMFGGTITQLLASFGTPFAFDPPAGCVLFLDEVGERPYRLDRMLTQLQQAGFLSRVAAIVFGELPNCDEPNGTVTARQVVADVLTEFPGPVIVGFPSGHTSRPAMTLPLGISYQVIAEGRPRLIAEESAVVPR
jgi:muramoyltetrapeptide carboxypeptidase